jgi:hypothetical protein
MKFDNRVPTADGYPVWYPAIGNLGIEALAGPSRLKARLQLAITGLDRQIS